MTAENGSAGRRKTAAFVTCLSAKEQHNTACVRSTGIAQTTFGPPRQLQVALRQLTAGTRQASWYRDAGLASTSIDPSATTIATRPTQCRSSPQQVSPAYGSRLGGRRRSIASRLRRPSPAATAAAIILMLPTQRPFALTSEFQRRFNSEAPNAVSAM